MRKVVLAALVLAFLVGLSPLAADPAIRRGIDVFTTVDNGKTFYSFADNPIPAGFFCKRSAAFAGQVPAGRSNRLSHMVSTLALTAASMAIGVPHSRVVSPGHLSVASMPILEPRPDTGEAKSR